MYKRWFLVKKSIYLAITGAAILLDLCAGSL